MQTFERPGGDFDQTREVTKVHQKDGGPQIPTEGRPDDQDRTPEARDSEPPVGEIKTISVGLTADGTLKSLRKAQGERNKQRPFVAPSNEDAKE